MAIRRLLVAHDYEIVGSVEDGGRVLEEAARLQPDLVLLDLHMPNMNGNGMPAIRSACEEPAA